MTDTGQHPEVVTARCTGCGRCVSACRLRLFTLEVTGFRKHARLLNPAHCSGCRACLAACPVAALVFAGEGKRIPPAPP